MHIPFDDHEQSWCAETPVRDLAADPIGSLPVGDALDPDNKIGPMVSSAHRDFVLRYTRTAAVCSADRHEDCGDQHGRQEECDPDRSDRFASQHFLVG